MDPQSRPPPPLVRRQTFVVLRLPEALRTIIDRRLPPPAVSTDSSTDLKPAGSRFPPTRSPSFGRDFILSTYQASPGRFPPARRRCVPLHDHSRSAFATVSLFLQESGKAGVHGEILCGERPEPCGRRWRRPQFGVGDTDRRCRFPGLRRPGEFRHRHPAPGPVAECLSCREGTQRLAKNQ